MEREKTDRLIGRKKGRREEVGGEELRRIAKD